MDDPYADPMDFGYPLTALITMAGMAGAYRLGARTRRARTSAVCPCKHAIGFHSNLKGACWAVTVFDRNRCQCRAYAGPELVSSLTMRPVVQDNQ